MTTQSGSDATKPGDAWYVPDVLSYWDPDISAIEQYSIRLAELDSSGRALVLQALRESVANHTAHLQDRAFAELALVAIDHVYRSALIATVWDDTHRDFLDATCGNLVRLADQRGLVIHFTIDNSFEFLERPLSLFPRWFAAAGCEYVCPQALAFRLSGTASMEPQDLSSVLPGYMEEAETMGRKIIAELIAGRRHFVFLDTEGISEQAMRDYGLFNRSQGFILGFRLQAPEPGSNIEYFLPPELV
jgi:hypothetical protein